MKKLYQNIPNILSGSRLLSPIILIPTLLNDNYLISVVVIFLFFLTDALDGFLARKMNVESKLGAKMDAIGDKLLVGSLLIPIISKYPIIIITIILELGIVLINTKRELMGFDPRTIKIGRVKMVFLFFLILLMYLSKITYIPVIIKYFFIVVTSVLQVITVKQYMDNYYIDKKRAVILKKIDELSKREQIETDLLKLFELEVEKDTLMDQVKKLKPLNVFEGKDKKRNISIS